MEYIDIHLVRISAMYDRVGVGTIAVVKDEDNEIRLGDLINHNGKPAPEQVYLVTGDFTGNKTNNFRHLVVSSLGDMSDAPVVGFNFEYKNGNHTVWTENNNSLHAHKLIRNNYRLYYIDKVLNPDSPHMAMTVREVR